MMLLWFTVLLASVSVDADYNRLNHITTVKQLLNTCSRSHSFYHKEKPSLEKGLVQTCKPWRERSCCTAEAETQMHTEQPLYNFEYSHCHKKISDECQRWLRLEHCITLCSPNTGPWLVKVKGYKINKERAFQMPLCQSDCDRWWLACQKELTCVRVWSNEFKWSKKGNSCPEGSRCQLYTELFANSTDYCENVFDHKWRVVPDRAGKCFQLEFKPGPNPNDEVARYWGYKLGSASRLDSGLIALAPVLLRLLL